MVIGDRGGGVGEGLALKEGREVLGVGPTAVSEVLRFTASKECTRPWGGPERSKGRTSSPEGGPTGCLTVLG
jgi:hypothetical protein